MKTLISIFLLCLSAVPVLAGPDLNLGVTRATAAAQKDKAGMSKETNPPRDTKKIRQSGTEHPVFTVTFDKEMKVKVLPK
ncbi:MAG: hypothetical protein UT48_C0016G0034 [Parcubacteria group bacterium GW2011_GWE2_39_37]|uniref:Uncharacterized protein n=1 Tax=Candidatus Falkowbacteria bacterium GW2011_GWF2_39_8 TaxID=1618642 RepID=A0A0G0PU42_9BACT|nr:MAG: hypothetical protein UT48_C0016G0034 [Parcubacteria group bacterium GW2011_GWE2_39_37]KKR31669.1 MAG: hypothetical protein UT64_C0054G0012 [Candidatus Falkowbacteria bacterium GW2011_GWF2_39_8]